MELLLGGLQDLADCRAFIRDCLCKFSALLSTAESLFMLSLYGARNLEMTIRFSL